jgi:hypothetical protein
MTLGEFAATVVSDLNSARPEAACERIRGGVPLADVRALVNAELRALVTGEQPPTKSAPAGQCRIASAPGSDVRVRSIVPRSVPGGSIRMLTRNTVVLNIGSAAFGVRRWRQPNPEPNADFDPRKMVEACDDETVEPGAAIVAYAAYDAVEFAGGDRHGAALTIAGAHRVPLAWLYRRDSRRAFGIDPGARDWLLVREFVAFAGALGDASSAAALAALAEHPSHFVRWAAAHALHRLTALPA